MFKVLLSTFKTLHGVSLSVNSAIYGRREFFFCAPTLWNDLRISLKSAVSVSFLKAYLKRFLFWEFFP